MSIASELVAGVIGALLGGLVRMGRRGRTFYVHLSDDDDPDATPPTGTPRKPS